MKQWKSLADSFRVYCTSTDLHLKASFEILCYSAKEVSSQATLEAGWISSRAEAFGVGGNLLSSFKKMWAHQSGKRPHGSVCVWMAEQKGSRLHSSAGLCVVCWSYSLFGNESQPSLNIRGHFFQTVQRLWAKNPQKDCQLNALSEQESCVWLLICLWVGGSVLLPF